MTPKEIKEPVVVNELNVSEGAECENEMQDWESHTDGSLGESNLSIS